MDRLGDRGVLEPRVVCEVDGEDGARLAQAVADVDYYLRRQVRAAQVQVLEFAILASDLAEQVSDDLIFF